MITGVKPANLIDTIDNNNISNLTIFSSVILISSDPPLIGMITRLGNGVPKDTHQNIINTGYYTFNRIPIQYTDIKLATLALKFESSSYN